VHQDGRVEQVGRGELHRRQDMAPLE
jgi:hypothetical protein